MALYVDAKKGILERLEAREWLPGDRLPPEGPLAEMFSVSVGTLRRAVSELCEEGILWKRQGSGTYVRSYRDAGAGYWNRLQPFQTRDGRPLILLERTVILLEEVSAPELVALKLRLPSDGNVIHVLRQMNNGKASAMGSDELFLRPDFFKGMTQKRFEERLDPDESLYSFYEREFGVEIVETSNFAYWSVGTHEEAERLLVPELEGMPLVSYHRVSKTYNHTPVEYRIIRMNAGDIQISMDITR